MAAGCSRARRRPRRWSVALASAAVVLGICTAVEIRAETKEDREDTKNAEENWSYARVRGISKDSVMLPLMMEEAGSADIFAGLTKYFEKAVTGGYTSGDSNCALHDKAWGQSVGGFSALRDWPQADTKCVSSNKPVSGEKHSAVDAEPLIDLMASNLQLVNKIGPAVVRELDLNFTHPDKARAWDHEEGALKRCKVWRTSGVRYRPNNSSPFQWYFLQGLTNDDHLRDFAEWERMYGTS